jgi:hypothetical protein
MNGLLALITSPHEVISWLAFKLAPSRSKLVHFRRLQKDDPAGGFSRIAILGTIHYDHVGSGAYPLADLRAVIQNLRPDLLLVEIRPESIARGKYGEGPIEMPFAALTALEAGIGVDGMDAVAQTFEEREDEMVRHLLEKVATRPSVLVLTGYSHVRGFLRRLKAAGYRERAFPNAEKRDSMTQAPGPLVVPPMFETAIRESAREAREGANGYTTSWADKRERLLPVIISKQQAGR